MLSEGVKKGLEAYIIRDDGTRFPEHLIAHSEGFGSQPSSTTCFLESEEGSTFVIVARSQPSNERDSPSHLRIIVRVDGREIRRIVPRYGETTNISKIISMEDGVLLEGALTFSRLGTTDEEAKVTLHASQLISVGQIVLDFERGVQGEYLGRSYAPPVVQSDMGLASERGKKLGGVVGSTSKVPYIKKRRSVAFTSHDIVKPFHRVIFNYRTRPVLQLMNIIEGPEPQSPCTQAGRSKKRNRSGSDAKEEDPKDTKPGRKTLLEARLRDLERQVKRIDALPRAAQGPAEVVDLTGNDSD